MSDELTPNQEPTRLEVLIQKKDDGSITSEELVELNSMQGTGGRRHRGSKKMHKGKRHGNASLRAWVTFVKKVQKEEGVSYKEAMMRAKQRKDKGEKWRGGSSDMDPMGDAADSSEEMEGGRRRRRTQRRSRSHSRSRSRSRGQSRKRSRRHH
jgi:hypothetical protein